MTNKKKNLESLLENIMQEAPPRNFRSNDEDMEVVEQSTDNLLTETVDAIFEVLTDKFDYFDSILVDKLGMRLHDPKDMFVKLVIKRMQEELVAPK